MATATLPTLPDDTDLATAAVAWATAGFRVLPCHPDGADAKHPITSLVPRGYMSASSDPEVVARWWEQQPDALIGVVPGPTHVVFDLDKSGGLDHVTNLLAASPDELRTSQSSITEDGTPKLHVWTRVPEKFIDADLRISNSSTILDGHGDVRGTNGYVIVAPSPHPDHPEHGYKWVNDVEPMDLPDDVVIELVSKPAKRLGGKARIEREKAAARRAAARRQSDDMVADGRMSAEAATMLTRAANWMLSDDANLGRHDRAVRISGEMVRWHIDGQITESAMRAALYGMMKKAGVDKSRAGGEAELRDEVNNLIDYQLAQDHLNLPRFTGDDPALREVDLPALPNPNALDVTAASKLVAEDAAEVELDDSGLLRVPSQPHSAVGVPSTDELDPRKPWVGWGPGEVGVAMRVAALIAWDNVNVKGEKYPYNCEDGKWVRDERALSRRVTEVLTKLDDLSNQQRNDVTADLRSGGIDAIEAGRRMQAIDDYRDISFRARNKTTKLAVVSLVRDYLPQVLNEDFDTGKIVSTEGKVVDLDRCVMTPAGLLDPRAGQYVPLVDGFHPLTKRTTGVAYRENLYEGSLWQKWIEFRLPDAKVREAFQQIVGAALLGGELQRVVWMPGPAGTGKSTVTSVLGEVFGDYGDSVPVSLLTGKSNSSDEYGIAATAGLRIGVGSETDVTDRMAAGLIKAVTGNDLMRGRHIYGEPFTFRSQLTLFMATNSLPVLQKDAGLERRLAVIPFEVQGHAPGTEGRNVDVASVFTGREREVLFSWAVEGCMKFHEANGLTDELNAAVSAASWQNEDDDMGAFLSSEMVVYGEQFSAQQHDLFLAYCVYTSQVHAIGNAGLRTKFNRRVRDDLGSVSATHIRQVGTRSVHNGVGLSAKASAEVEAIVDRKDRPKFVGSLERIDKDGRVALEVTTPATRGDTVDY